VSTDAEIWMSLETLAASYERTHGTRPNQLRVGAAVAAELEPTLGQPGGHPRHLSWTSPTRGIWQPARPVPEGGFLAWVRVRHACLKAGGHWWHPADAMIAWFCCQCGKDVDGTPRDGTRGW
jgi:hypothetical protein